MGKASIGIGVDDATGQPQSGPEGPYITDRDDDARRKRPAPRERPRERAASAQKRHSVPREGLAGRRKGQP
jgi:hypothetical protein